jgi:hypothetical protein
MPMNKGPDYGLLIEELKERGICEEANNLGAHKVADGILVYLCPKSCTWLDPVVLEFPGPKSKKRRRQPTRPNSQRPPPPQSPTPNSQRPPPPQSTTPLNTIHVHQIDGIDLLYHAIHNIEGAAIFTGNYIIDITIGLADKYLLT